ncbi:MAG: hypothetical protein FVQ80_10355 [Planctomycetes bacterium]|nr:hypothetical protein [Planctomycetota bacterium]
MKFQVFEKGKLSGKFELFGAYLFGSDGIAIRRSKISFKKGVVECEKPNLETCGLALLWRVGGFGKVLLPTACLPERDKPYILNVELARAKLMQIITKREDWSFFDGMNGSDIFQEAQNLFIQSIQEISNPSKSSMLADSSIEKALVFSERLANEQAESLFALRRKNHGFGRGCLGCRIDPLQVKNAKYMEKLLGSFNYVTVPINWGQIEVERGIYDFEALDACMKVLGGHRLAICGGPLLRFSKAYLPKWLLGKKLSFEKVGEAAYEFVSELVNRYTGQIRVWRVISGLNVFNCLGFSFEQILEMTRASTMAVKACSERSLKIVEVSNPWGEYYGTSINTLPPIVYMDMVLQSGISFDAFGLQVHIGKNQAGMHVRDMMQISAVLDNFGLIAKPLYITEVEVSSEASGALESPEVSGVWHKSWDEKRQGEWVEQFYKIAFSKSFVDTVTYSHLTDVKNSVISNSGLLRGDMETKESFNKLRKLHKGISSH